MQKKRLLSLLLACSICMTLLPTAGFAAEGAVLPLETQQDEDGAPAPLPGSVPVAPEGGEQLPLADAAAAAPRAATLENVARNGIATATASSSEADTLGADKAIDGDTTSRGSRWSITQAASLTVDLGAVYDVSNVKIFWERRNVKAYSVKTGETADALTAAKSMTAIAATKEETIALDAPTKARFVQLDITDFQNEDLDNLVPGGYHSASLYEIEVYADPATKVVVPVNVALHKTATATSQEADSVAASNAVDGVRNGVPGSTGSNRNTRWGNASSDKRPKLTVNLGANYMVEKVKIYWFDTNATLYHIQTSSDGATYETVKTISHAPDATTGLEEIPFDAPKNAKYVRLDIETFPGSYGTTSLFELEAMADPMPVPAPPPAANVNLAQGCTATSSGDDSNVPAGAVNGDPASGRWGSNGARPSWLKVDLGAERDIAQVVLYWERRNATDYKVQVSNTGADGSWRDVAAFTSYPVLKRQSILLAEPTKARYVRLFVADYDGETSIDGSAWGNVGVWEFEVYQANQKFIDDYLPSSITVAKDAAELAVPDMGDSGFSIAYVGTDYEQVIDANRRVHRPLVDTQVVSSFTVTKDTYKKNFDIPVLVKGETETNTGNAVPAVIPELAEWVGGAGNFTAGSSIVLRTADEALLRPMAEEFAADYADIFGSELTISVGDATADGAFYFALGSADTALGKEGYRMTVGSGVSVEAVDATGAYWSTRTLLQILKQNSGTIPQGTMRDYPKFEVRGFIMDVARKPFSEQFLEDVTKNLSWFKMNDFQVHLNDNLIFLEDYEHAGLDEMNAYSGFRLESDMVVDGVPLTSTDKFYTKEWFGNFIDESKARGVNIVPEIDTPAHSLALTKVRPDLRKGDYSRDNDHLNLAGKYEEVKAFTQSIFNEYMTGAAPTFRNDTIVHVGTDEYNGNDDAKTAFCNYMDDMIEFVQNSGRKVRAWGSWTSAGYLADVRSENVQLSMWNAGYADPKRMYDEGFGLINTQDGALYMVPNAGYYGDYLSRSRLYSSWNPYDMGAGDSGAFQAPAGSPQMLGGEYAVWNDAIDTRANGMSQYDIYDRIQSAMPAMAEKLWGDAKTKTFAEFETTSDALGVAPSSNFYGELDSAGDTVVQYKLNGDVADTSGNAHHGTLPATASFDNAGHEGKALRLNGGNSTAELPLLTGGPQYSVELYVRRDAAAAGEQILLESASGAIKAAQKGTGKVGFSREEYDYSFNYTLPADEWVKLKFVCTESGVHGAAKLYVNDVWQDTITRERLTNYYDDHGTVKTNSGETAYNATMLVPLERIGSTTHAFKGLVDEITVSKTTPQTLAQLITEMDAVKAADFAQDAAWITFQTKLAAAKAAPTDESLAAGLQEARRALCHEQAWQLKQHIARAKLLTEADYTAETWATLQAALTEAEAVVATQATADTDRKKVDLQNQLSKPTTKMYVAMRDLAFRAAPPATPITGAVITLPQASYTYTGSAIAPVPTVKLGGTTLTATTDYTVSYENNTAVGTAKVKITGVGAYTGTAEKTFAITAPPSSSDDDDDYTPPTTTTTNTTDADGTKVTTVTDKKTGATTVTATALDGTTAKSVTDKNGKTEATVTVPEKAVKNSKDGIVQLPVKGVEATKDGARIGITLPKLDGATKVGVPVKNLTDGTIAVLVKPDGTEEIIVGAAARDGVLIVPMSGSGTIEIRDNSKNFSDVKPTDWAASAVQFVTSRELFNGTGNNLFSQNENMNRAMLTTVLFRLANEPKSNKPADFGDVPAGMYYSDAVAWASENNIVTGNGKEFDPNGATTREQLALMLYRYAGSPVVDTTLGNFADGDSVSDWAQTAMIWATQNKIIGGTTGNNLAPQASATRAEVATMLQRFVTL